MTSSRLWNGCRRKGKAPMLAAVDGELAGIVAVADTGKNPRISQQAIAALKSHGVNVVMLTGDNENNGTCRGKFKLASAT